MRWLGCLLLFACASASALADESISVCYNYGCLVQAEVVYSDTELRRVGDLLSRAQNAMHERALLGMAIGWMLAWAGERSPIAADRGGNYADEGVEGRMDCIDHATTTTRLLQLFERRGWLRFHRILEPVRRTRVWVFQHFSAQIEEKYSATLWETSRKAHPKHSNDPTFGRYAVDSWFVDNGQPAVVLPVARWLASDGSDFYDEDDENE